jgi:pimeloyl-ACP methyl ester carboxylesterase
MRKSFFLWLAVFIAFTLWTGNLYAKSFVMIGGNRIHYELQGRGQPCIVLVSGIWGPLDAWDPVFPQLVRLSTTLRYSRPGLGLSTFTGTDKRTFDDVVRELDELLEKLQIPKPFILVGHSYGGLIVRAYAGSHPDQVAGLLLVDSTFENYLPVLEKIEPQAREIEMKFWEKWMQELPVDSAARLYVEALFALWDKRSLWNDQAASKIPTVVLTSVKLDPDDVLRNTKQLMQARYDAQHRWLNTLAWGMHVSTPISGHSIQFEEPSLVVQATNMLLTVIRSSNESKR